MPRYLDPPTVPDPHGRYAQGVLLAPYSKRLLISGQTGQTVDGSIPEGLEAQTEICFARILDILDAAGMTMKDLVKLTIYCTQRGGISTSREVRSRILQGVTSASTYVEVAGLANPLLLVEIEGEALREASF